MSYEGINRGAPRASGRGCLEYACASTRINITDGLLEKSPQTATGPQTHHMTRVSGGSRMVRSSLFPPSHSPSYYLSGRNPTALPDSSHPACSSKDYSKHFPSSTWGRSFWNHPIPSEASVGAVAPSSPSLQSMELLGSTVPTSKTWPGS